MGCAWTVQNRREGAGSAQSDLDFEVMPEWPRGGTRAVWMADWTWSESDVRLERVRHKADLRESVKCVCVVCGEPHSRPDFEYVVCWH